MTTLDLDRIRARFPALSLEQDGRPVVFLDGPGGTQVPGSVVDAVADYLRWSNANAGGAFLTSQRSDAMLAEAHAALTDFLGAGSPEEVHFGPNMTSLTFSISRAIGATLGPGDEVLITRLDHEANRGPWQRVAADRGVVVRELEVEPSDCTLDLGRLDDVLTERTRVLAVGYASNAVGTINPVAELVRRAHAVGALVFVDAVHYAPHGAIDVQALGADFLACSVYKFFGPHVGVLWGRAEVMDRLPAYKVRPAHDRWETGTQNHEGIAGALAAVEYLAELGRTVVTPESTATPTSRREALLAGFRAIQAHEGDLARLVLDRLARIPGARLWGIADPDRVGERTPTFALRLDGWAPAELAAELGRRGIFVWDGDFYATTLIERLGLAESGGVVRVGLAHYTTADEVERLLDELAALAAQRPAPGAA